MRRVPMPDTTLLLQFLVSGVALGCVYGLIGIGYCVIYNASGIVNFAQGSFVMLGGMAYWLLLKLLPVPAAAMLAILLVAAVGVAMERLVVRPLWRRGATMFVMILATLAAEIVIEQLTLLAVGDQPKALAPFSAGGPLWVGPVAVGRQSLWIVGSALLLIAALAAFFLRTQVGRAMRACAVDRVAASLLGIPVGRLLSGAFALSAALGAAAGILVAPEQYAAYNLGVPYAISGFIAAIVGGFGSALGAFLGGIILGVTQSLGVVVFGAGTKNIVALTILLAFLLARPSGLLGTGKA
jgi:branched-chain amino acid transport system permease protein